MKKHYVSASRKNYGKLCDSLSDTEVDVRKHSLEQLDKEFMKDFELKCSVGDGLKKLQTRGSSPIHQLKQSTTPPKPSTRYKSSESSNSPPKHSPNRKNSSSKVRTNKAFTQMKIKDEAKIDLRNYDASESLSVRSMNKIYPIAEASENASRASSKMRLEQYSKQREVQRIMEENRAKCRPTGNANRFPSMLQIHDGIEIFKPFYRSSQSIVESEFGDHQSNSSSPPKSKDLHGLYDRFGSLSSFKRAQIHQLSSDSQTYLARRENYLKKFDDSYHELMTIRSYSSSEARPASCFGCFAKPFASICKRKSKKY